MSWMRRDLGIKLWITIGMRGLRRIGLWIVCVIGILLHGVSSMEETPRGRVQAALLFLSQRTLLLHAAGLAGATIDRCLFRRVMRIYHVLVF